MRMLKTILAVLIVLVTASLSYAQTCGPAASLVDSVFIESMTAVPGDTISIPIYMRNAMDIASFQLYFEYDPAIITPIILSTEVIKDPQTQVPIDTLYIFEHTQTSRVTLDPIFTLQVVNDLDFSFPDSSGRERIKVLGLSGIPGFGVKVPVAIDSGTGTVMAVKFVVAANAPQFTVTPIYNYAERIEVIVDGQILLVGCQYAKYTDTTGLVDIRLSTKTGKVTIDENYIPPDLPVINSFLSVPASITVGGSATLVWDVVNHDSVIILPLGQRFLPAVSQTSVSPTSTTNYQLTAYNADGSVSATRQVTVTTDPDPTSTPTVSLNPTTTYYEIEQGQTVSFSVSSNDPDGDDLTLTANNLPPNAQFSPSNPVLGNTNVSGDFSFTPDINQEGAFVVTFVGRDNTGLSSSQTVTIQVNALQFDVLFTSSAEGQAPVGGLSGTGGVYFPINLVSSQTVYGVQFDIAWDHDLFTIDSFVITGRTVEYALYDNLGTVPGEAKVVVFGLANEPIGTVVDTTAIVYAVISIDSAALPGDYPIAISNGFESVNPDPNFPGLPLVTSDGIIQVDNPGDVNLDKNINVADLVNVVAYIIGNYGFSPRQYDVADVVTNDTVNVFDLVGIVNLVFGLPIDGGQAAPAFDGFATLSLEYPDLFPGSSDMIVVHSELPTEVAGVEMDIWYNIGAVRLGTPQLTEEASDMILAYKDDGQGRMKVLLHMASPTSGRIKAGVADLIDIPVLATSYVAPGDISKIRISNAWLSTSAASVVPFEGSDPIIPTKFSLAQNYPNPFNPTTIIEFQIGADNGLSNQHVRLDIFNILGQNVRTLIDKPMVPGDHRISWNATDNFGRKVATGLYLYRLQVGHDSRTRKMVLLK